MLGRPNPELPLRNLLPHDAQTLSLLVLILGHARTKFQQTWSIRRVAAAVFSSRRPKNFGNEKIFLCLKIAEILGRIE